MTATSSFRDFLWAWGLHIGILAVASIGYIVLGAQQHLPYFWAGGVLGGINVLVILWSINRVMMKKPIALTVAVSVFKYGFLIAIFWLAARVQVDSSSFFMGLALMLPTLTVVLFKLSKNGKS